MPYINRTHTEWIQELYNRSRRITGVPQLDEITLDRNDATATLISHEEYRNRILGEWGQPAPATLHPFYDPTERRDNMFSNNQPSTTFVQAHRYIKNVWNRDSQNDRTTVTDIGLNNWTTEAMMYLYKTQLHLYTKSYNLLNDAISDGSAASNLRANPRPTHSAAAPELKVLKFALINKGKNIFKYLDENYKDEELKTISLGLQTDREHSIRVHKINTKLITVTASAFYDSTVRQIIALIPVLFDLDVSPEVKEICKHYGAGRYEEWITAWDAYINSLNLGEAERREALKQLCSSSKTKRLTAAMKDLTNYQRNITDIEKELGEYYKKLRTAELTLMGLELEEVADDTVLYNFINNNKFIHNFNYDGAAFNCFITAPLSYYDLELLKPYYKTSKSIITQDENMADLFNACFISRTHQMWCGTEVVIKPHSNEVEALRTGRPALYLGQPHLTGFNCWGTNRTLMSQALTKADYIGLLSIIIASTQNYNFADTTVLDRWIQTIKSNYSVPFIYNKETKKFMSYNDFKEARHAANTTNSSPTTGVDATISTDSIELPGSETNVRIQDTSNDPDFF